jgi:multiple sugar transport system substrate-binding protein
VRVSRRPRSVAGRTHLRRAALGAATVLAVALAAIGCTDGSREPRPAPTTRKPDPTSIHLTFGVYGPKSELTAFRSTVAAWNSTSDVPDVELETWPNQKAMRDALEGGAPVPDVFLTSRSDLSWLLEKGYTQPVDELLDERGVDFGDGYSRDALEAFSTADRLQCMPYGVSPMVIYYNKQLVNFDRMRSRGLDAPDVDATRWSFEQFTAAADFASRPGRGSKGVHIAATLPGLAPFIESGGGSVFDDTTAPTRLTLSEDDSKSALERTLVLLRDPQVTLDETQLASASSLAWFKRGKLGMIAGYRSLVPTLRLVPGLDFDVMPMPVLDSASTVGDVTGLCLSKKSADVPAAADFMVHELSAESVSRVTRTGYLAPANLQVALSDDFLQPGRRPQHAVFFNNSVRSMSLAPLIDTLPELETTVEPELSKLVYGVGVLDLDGLTQQIDEESRAVLDPASVSESPDPSETGGS